MPFPLAAAAGLSVASSLLGANAARRAARAQEQAANRSVAESRYQNDLAREDLAPYRDIGTQALNDVAGVFGYTPYSAPTAETRTVGRSPFRENDWNSIAGVWGQIRPAARFEDINWNAVNGAQPISDQARQFLSTNWGNIRPAANLGDVDWNSFTHAGIDYGDPAAQAAPAPAASNANFFTSPDYNFVRGEGTRDIQNTFAARGGAQSGNALRALTEFSSNLAAGEFDNWFGRRMQLAGQGQNAVNTGVQVGQNTAANVGNALMAGGDARASGIVGSANALIGGMNDAASMIGYRNYLRRNPTRSTPSYGATYDPRYGAYG